MGYEIVIYIHNGNYSDRRKDEIMQFAATLVELGDDMLNEVSQKERDK